MTSHIDRRSFLGLGGTALLAAGSAADLQAAAPADRELLERLKAFCAAERHAMRVPGVTVCVANATGTHLELVDGVADLATGEAARQDQLFQIGSITKSMAALTLFRLAEMGRLNLDAPLANYLEGLPLPEGTPIRISHVLNHSSGMPGAAPAFPRGEQRLWRGFEPGTRFSYSNGAYALLNMVIERVTGEPLDEAIKHLVFEPLGMHTATARIDSSERGRYAQGHAPMSPNRPYLNGSPLVPAAWVDFVGAAGSVAATAADMGRYVSWIAKAAAGNPTPLLRAASAERFFAPTIAAPAHGADTHQANGLFVDVNNGKTTSIHHTGGMLGFSSALHVDPLTQVGAFASANLAAGGYRPQRIAKYAAELFAARERKDKYPDPPAIPDATAISDADRYVGVYRSDQGSSLRLLARSNRLLLEIDGREIALHSTASKDIFNVPHARFAEYPVGFVRAGDKIAHAFHGRTLYAAAGQKAPHSPHDWSALEGAYLCENPWRGTVRVLARGDGLWLNGYVPLLPTGSNLFREGVAEWSPEIARFDGFVNGRCQRLTRSGTDYFRVPVNV